MRARLRVPLLTGDGFALGVAWATCLVMPSATCALAAVPLYATGHWIAATLLLLAGLFFTGAFWQPAKSAWVERPSDLVLDDGGFRVAGGVGRGLRAAWSEITRVELVSPRAGLAEAPAELFVTTRPGGRRLVSRTFEERESLAAIRDLLRAGADGAGEPRAIGEVAVVRCAGCGAPASPVDAASTRCASCGAAVAVPEALRARMREVATRAAVSARAARLLARVVRHPPSGAARMGVLAFGALSALAWPVALAAFSVALFRDELFGRHLLYVLFPAGASLAASIASSIVVVSRRTVRVVALDFAAAPPRASGDPPACRVCGAPLAGHGPEALLVACAYCGAVNVLGLEVPRSFEPDARKEAGLEETLLARDAERLFRAVGFVVFGVPALVVSIASARAVFFPTGETAAKIACHRGDAAACEAVEGGDPSAAVLR